MGQFLLNQALLWISFVQFGYGYVKLGNLTFFGPFGSTLVNSGYLQFLGLFRLFWPLDLFQLIWANIDLVWPVKDNLVHFGPLKQFRQLSLQIISFQSILVLFCPFWSYLVHCGPILSILVIFSTFWSYYVHFGPVLSILVLFSPFWSYLVHQIWISNSNLL